MSVKSEKSVAVAVPASAPLVHKAVAEITTDHVRQFVGLVNGGIECWVKAGKLLVQMSERNPNTYRIIMKECPAISADTLIAFEKIGRNEVSPYVLIDKSAGCQKLLSLPFHLQNELYGKKIPVLVEWVNGVAKVVDKTPSQMTRLEAKRVFHSNGVRSVDDQKIIFPAPATRREIRNWVRTKPGESKVDLRSSNGTAGISGPSTKSLGFYAVRKGIGGAISFEKTPARPPSAQRVRVDKDDGMAVIELYEFNA